MDHFKQVYTNTEYKVFDERITRPLVVGKIQPEIDLLLEELNFKTYAYLTAWNPRSISLADEVNLSRNKELVACFEKIPEIQWLPGIAKSYEPGWPGEECYLILGISREIVEQLAFHFEQNAYLFGELHSPVELVFTKY